MLEVSTSPWGGGGGGRWAGKGERVVSWEGGKAVRVEWGGYGGKGVWVEWGSTMGKVGEWWGGTVMWRGSNLGKVGGSLSLPSHLSHLANSSPPLPSPLPPPLPSSLPSPPPPSPTLCVTALQLLQFCCLTVLPPFPPVQHTTLPPPQLTTVPPFATPDYLSHLPCSLPSHLS